MNILTRFQAVRAFVFDMDGVLTDGNILVDATGQWQRHMNMRDGYALQLAVKSGFWVMVISGSNSTPVQERLNRLGISDVFMNVSHKAGFLKEKLADKGFSVTEILYMGDDMPDYQCMKIAGIASCPANAAFEIKSIASYISPYKGGDGCVRDVIEKVLKLNDKWNPENEKA